MEFILDMAVTFWQWTIVISLILIGFIASIFDGQGEDRVGFYYTEMPQMSPIKIETADMSYPKVSNLMVHQYLSFLQCGFHPLASCLWAALFTIMAISMGHS